MQIKVGRTGIGNARFVATLLDDDGSTMTHSMPTYRPGCAVREVINWLYKTYGDIKSMELDITEVE